jgi:hypothetical protein
MKFVDYQFDCFDSLSLYAPIPPPVIPSEDSWKQGGCHYLVCRLIDSSYVVLLAPISIATVCGDTRLQVLYDCVAGSTTPGSSVTRDLPARRLCALTADICADT